jgi:hypothetical protein
MHTLAAECAWLRRVPRVSRRRVEAGKRANDDQEIACGRGKPEAQPVSWLAASSGCLPSCAT